jgi:predicted RNase H-like nuclease (RuvC/YqgF family)
MTIVLPVQSKIAEHKEELTHVKRKNRDLKKADEQYAVKVANLEKKLEKAQAETEHNKKEAEYYQDEMKAKCGFDTLEKKYKRDINKLESNIEQLNKDVQDKQQLIEHNHYESKQKEADQKQTKLDMKDFEAMKKENIDLKRSISDNTEVRDAKKKMEADRLRIQRAADGKVRRVEQELEARDEKIARLQRAAAQQEEEEGDEASEGMDD